METSLSRGGLSLDTLSAPRIEATLRHGVITTVDKALLDAAWETVRPVVRWTPMLRTDHVDSVVGARFFLKSESLQLAGSFKMRGACFRVSRLLPDERGRGVVAFSSGNFAQALALAGRLAGVPVTIVMPRDAPERKVELTRRAGATGVLTDHGARNREEVANARAHEIADEEGRVFLHPFDDPLVVAGQSTLMRGVQLDAERERVRFDSILCPVGGGGLIAGTALAEKHVGSGAEVIAVEPDACDDMRRSLISHRRERNERDVAFQLSLSRPAMGHSQYDGVRAGCCVAANPVATLGDSPQSRDGSAVREAHRA